MLCLKCQFCCSAGVWPAIVYTQTDTEGETERGQSPEYILKSSKNTIFNEHPVAKMNNACAMFSNTLNIEGGGGAK